MLLCLLIRLPFTICLSLQKLRANRRVFLCHGVVQWYYGFILQTLRKEAAPRGLAMTSEKVLYQVHHAASAFHVCLLASLRHLINTEHAHKMNAARVVLQLWRGKPTKISLWAVLSIFLCHVTGS